MRLIKQNSQGKYSYEKYNYYKIVQLSLQLSLQLRSKLILDRIQRELKRFGESRKI